MMTQIATPSTRESCSSEAEYWWVYMLRCADRSIYVGVTRCLIRRLRQHNGELAGGAKYTRGRRPVEVVWRRPAGSRGDAQSLEAQLRKLSKQD
ncbi:MAG: GIY-YIG nuclease family protein, partial [Luminiphilus sp.]